MSPAPVRVRVAALQTSLASVPNEERVRTEEFHTLIGIEVARDEEAVVTRVSVFAFTTAAIEEEAVCTSESVAREPEESPAPVRVRVPFVHTSAAKVPKPVSVRLPAAQTLEGMSAIEAVMLESVDPSEVDAVSTAAFVFALMTAAREEDAVCTVVFVFAFMTAARDDEAVPTLLSVFALIAVWLFEIAVPREVDAASTAAFVFAFTTAAIELDAIPTRVSVLPFIAVWLFVIALPREEEAVVTSD